MINLSALFIRRPVMTTLVFTALVAFGVIAYFKLPVSDLPNVDFPTISVSAALPGASPDTMAASMARPLEQEFSTIDGLESMTSSSSLGRTSITLQFALSRSLDSAAQDVQAAISRAGGRLPRNMPSPPSYAKVNPAERPIMYLALTSPTLPTYTLNDFAETLLAQRISMVSGVAQVSVYGAQKYAVRVQADPQALASRGIGLDELATAVQKANSNLPTGTLNGAYKAYTVQSNGQLDEAKAYRSVIVAYRNGKPVRLDQVARVIDSVENDKTAAWFRDQRAIVLAVQRQPGTNTVAVAEAVSELLPSFRERLPGSVDLTIISDRSVTIRESVDDVQYTLLLTLVLVTLVIFLFLRNFSATLIPSIAIPMSIVGTFCVMYAFGYSLDNLSLLALTLSVGFVVDDAIVMLENIVRHMEKGDSALEASLKGSREVGFTILSMTISLAVVFVPILFMAGILGRLFREFGVTIAAAILISGVVSLTLTPMMCSRFLRHQAPTQRGALYRASEWVFDAMLAFYDWGLKLSLRHHVVVMILSLAVLIGSGWLFMKIPKGFLPSEDNGMVFIGTYAQEGISFEDMVRHQQQAAKIILDDANVYGFMSSAGARGNLGGSNNGVIFVVLKPKPERKISAQEFIEQLRPKVAGIPGLKLFMQVPPPIRISGRLTKSQYQYTLQSPDLQALYAVTPKLAEAMAKIPGLRDVTTDLELKNPQVMVEIDRDRAAVLGVSAEQIENTLYSAYGSRQISSIYAANDTYQVILEVDPKLQRRPSDLSMLYVRSNTGKQVPLDAVAKVRETLGPLSVNHNGQLPAVTVSFDLDPGHSLGAAVERVNDVARGVLPATISTNFSGSAEVFQSSLQGMGLLLLMAVLIIYMVLGILYESFIHPLTILSALPFAGFGALATLWLFDVELSVYAFVGVIMLVGVVKKNGIMMVDFALERRHVGVSAAEAIREASLVRFRPIMMTTMSALAGTLPIALGIGAGAESRQPLGLAVVGGLIFSQFLTLYVTPVFYVYMDHLQDWLGRHVRLGQSASPAERVDS